MLFNSFENHLSSEKKKRIATIHRTTTLLNFRILILSSNIYNISTKDEELHM